MASWLARGANVNGVNDEGSTTLMLAAISGRSDACTLLLEVGADPSFRDKDGRTTLDLIGNNSKAAFALQSWNALHSVETFKHMTAEAASQISLDEFDRLTVPTSIRVG